MRARFLAPLSLFCLLFFAGLGQAATWTVDTLADELDSPAGATLSLREAVRDAATGDRIEFAPSLDGATMGLPLGRLTVSKNLTIDAMSLASGITLDGAHARGLLTTSTTVTLRGLKLIRGRDNFGAAVRNSGNLTMEHCSISDCLGLTGATGISHTGTSLTLRHCSVVGGAAFPPFDGGPAIEISSGSSKLVNCTIANNEAKLTSGLYLGGSSTVDLIHCTVTGNRSTSSGAAVNVVAGSFRIQNSVLAGNLSGTAGGSPSTSDLQLLFNVQLQKIGQNFLSSNASVATQFPAGPTTGTAAAPLDPLLSPVGLFGGRTHCRIPLSGSGLLDLATATADSPATDQRGFPRIAGAAADLGAGESTLSEFFPVNGASGVSIKPNLEWSCEISTPNYTVKFGDSPATLATVGTTGIGRWALPVLAPGTTYYWRIDSTGGGNTVTGPLLSFTTLDLVVTKAEDEKPEDVAIIPGMSLREAVLMANANPGLDVIRFHPDLAGESLTLVWGLIDITSDLRIDGQSIPGGVTLSGSCYRIRAATEFNHLSIVEGKSSNSSDGVIHVNGAFTARNCTITNGRANLGSGIYLQTGSCTLIHCTVTGNLANFAGGGIYRSGGTLTLENSIVAGNGSLETNPDIRTTVAPTLRGKNLIGNNSGSEAVLPAGPLTGTAAAPLAPVLAPAGAYTGGAALYCPLLPGSPALGQALPLATTPAIDQIGQPRPGDGAADLGAAEYTPSLPLTVPASSEQEVVTRPALYWNIAGESFEIFFGTDPAALASLGTSAKGTFQLPQLAQNTTYYWRVDSSTAGVTTTGTI